MADRPRATTIEALDAHLAHVFEALDRIEEATGNMATKKDVEDIARRMDDLATKAYVDARLESLQAETPSSLVKRLAAIARDLLPIIAILAALWGAAVTVVHYSDLVATMKAKP